MRCPSAPRVICKGFARERVRRSTTGASAERIEASGSQMTRRQAAIPLALGTVLLIAGLVIWWLVGAVRAPGETREIAVSADESSIVDIVPPASETQSPNPVELPAVERPWEELPATAVINSPNCLFVAGTGEAAGVAIVLAGPSPDAAWFAAVDQDGVLFGAHLEFGRDGLPLFDLGRRDGAVLMGFRTADHHAQIVLDGEPIYEAEGVWSSMLRATVHRSWQSSHWPVARPGSSSACPSTRFRNTGTEDSSVRTRRRSPLSSPYSLTAEHPRDVALDPCWEVAGHSSQTATA